MTKTIQFEQSKVREFSAKPREGGALSRLKCSALLTQPIAKQMGIDHLVFRERMVGSTESTAIKSKKRKVFDVREGFRKTELAYEIGRASVVITPKGFGASKQLTLATEGLSRFVVVRSNKNGLKLHFEVRVVGPTDNAHKLLDYALMIGEAPATIKVEAEAIQITIGEIRPRGRPKAPKQAAPKESK